MTTLFDHLQPARSTILWGLSEQHAVYIGDPSDVTYQGTVPWEHVEKLFDYPIVRAESMHTYPGRDGHHHQVAGKRSVVGVFEGAPTVFAEGVSERYPIHQPLDFLIGKVTPLIGRDLGVTRAGVLKSGAVNFVLAGVPEAISLPGQTEANVNLAAFTSHDQSLATGYSITTEIVICRNMVSRWLQNQEKNAGLKVKHTARSLALTTEHIGEALGLLAAAVAQLTSEVEAFLGITMENAVFEKRVHAWAGGDDAKFATRSDGKPDTATRNRYDERMATILHLWREDERVSSWRKTGWGALMALNTYDQHYQPIRTSSRSERNALAAINGRRDERDNDFAGRVLGLI